MGVVVRAAVLALALLAVLVGVEIWRWRAHRDPAQAGRMALFCLGPVLALGPFLGVGTWALAALGAGLAAAGALAQRTGYWPSPPGAAGRNAWGWPGPWYGLALAALALLWGNAQFAPALVAGAVLLSWSSAAFAGDADARGRALPLGYAAAFAAVTLALWLSAGLSLEKAALAALLACAGGAALQGAAGEGWGNALAALAAGALVAAVLWAPEALLPWGRVLLAFALALGVGLAARVAGWLSPGGAWAAGAVGGVILGAGGWLWAGLLVVFFLTSGGWTAWRTSLRLRRGGVSRGSLQPGEQAAAGGAGSARQAGVPEDAEPGRIQRLRRDAGQVLANGGLAAVLALLATLFPSGSGYFFLAFAGALAAANADTWATEIGMAFGGQPRNLLDWRPVSPGTSGGVTLAGTLGSLAGAGLMGLAAAVPALWAGAPVNRGLAASVAAGGFLGGLLDSLLGAGAQGSWLCPACGARGEEPVCAYCGAPAERVRGLGWLNNNTVNALNTLAGALLSAFLYLVFVVLAA